MSYEDTVNNLKTAVNAGKANDDAFVKNYYAQKAPQAFEGNSLIEKILNVFNSEAGQKIMAGLQKNPYKAAAYLQNASTADAGKNARKTAYNEMLKDRVSNIEKRREKESDTNADIKKAQIIEAQRQAGEMAKLGSQQGFEKEKMSAEKTQKEAELAQKTIENEQKAKEASIDMQGKLSTTGKNLGLKGRELSSFMNASGKGGVKPTWFGFGKNKFVPATTSLPNGLTEDDIQYTMKKHGVTREAVLSKIGAM